MDKYRLDILSIYQDCKDPSEDVVFGSEYLPILHHPDKTYNQATIAPSAHQTATFCHRLYERLGPLHTMRTQSRTTLNQTPILR